LQIRKRCLRFGFSPRLREHLGGVVERNHCDPLACRGALNRAAGKVERTPETSGNAHAERAIDGNDAHRGRTGCARSVRAGECGGQQQQRSNASRKQQEIPEATTPRAGHRRMPQQPYGTEWNFRRDIAPEKMQHDWNGDRQRADEKCRIQEPHARGYFRLARAAR
jgi:hypothetical protein